MIPLKGKIRMQLKDRFDEVTKAIINRVCGNFKEK